jgi:hypothetical protein
MNRAKVGVAELPPPQPAKSLIEALNINYPVAAAFEAEVYGDLGRALRKAGAHGREATGNADRRCQDFSVSICADPKPFR